ncbi:hypothetical protein H4R26_004914 [Coemansia thaxteri]|uniref:HMG box domain-containing protein n=1 Tax=Coemansia thaxteri TaxID=2663907 RepID=A0A9W8B9Q1_9FUNG|nr:hypothetical protein H4R26_004914 [Coemansia thaxteri]
MLTTRQRLVDSATSLDCRSLSVDPANKWLYQMPTGKLKTKAPNAFMLFRLHAVKPLKGTRMTAGEINQSISNKWNQMPQEEKDLYKLLSRKIQSQLDIMNSRVPAKTKCVEQVQILVPDLLRASTDSSNCYTQISKFGSVNVLQPLELGPGTPRIVEFQPDESGVGLLYPRWLPNTPGPATKR